MPNKIVDTTRPLVGPVSFEKTQDTGYQFIYRSVGSVGVVDPSYVTIKTGTSRLVTVRDYQLGNPWLAVFNSKGDGTIFTLSDTETIIVSR